MAGESLNPNPDNELYWDEMEIYIWAHILGDDLLRPLPKPTEVSAYAQSSSLHTPSADNSLRISLNTRTHTLFDDSLSLSHLLHTYTHTYTHRDSHISPGRSTSLYN
ncbi:hypothetical protein PNOK_0953200 [Pyrrhoderma noxium]|uniref:Uncharacterized protein n=1 Tax=Pyrrhoderma noxium TaxID=2282107 RepID=A0A286U621_9AGAM|nr:hypothetical protein PNOK_0953200 [Pyrrhoderma noxium]